MAFSAANLFKVADLGQGRALWDYYTADTSATVDTAGYFSGGAGAYSGAYYQMNIGDVIILMAGVGGTLELGLLAVNAKASGTIDVANKVDLIGTDSD